MEKLLNTNFVIVKLIPLLAWINLIGAALCWTSERSKQITELGKKTNLLPLMQSRRFSASWHPHGREKDFFFFRGCDVSLRRWSVGWHGVVCVVDAQGNDWYWPTIQPPIALGITNHFKYATSQTTKFVRTN